MVSSRHEAAHRIFQERPELLAPVFRILDLSPPEKAAVEVLTPDATEIRPLERRVDSVLRVKPFDGDDFLLAIEAQGRCDPDKAVNWAYYMSYPAAKYKQPALLLVVCQDKATAEWATGPFRVGVDDWTALSVHPLVLGPGNVPVILDPDEAAQDLTLATFSALTHGSHQDAPAILKALARAMGTADPESVSYYSELLEIGLGSTTPAGITWRNEMSVGTYFPGRGTLIEETFLKGKAEGAAEGEARGRAQGVLRVLEKRGIPTLAETRDRITNCTDLDTLDRWLDRAFAVSTADELFTEDD
ncbi:hypothetical protein [Streptomyces sp. NEAU-YJ-81]|uniref:hypothetical protein n=1 Tax=Streptomyces sp. NEAU-YJ-81 TaxID=2820288 RepID=UPI001ABCB174|nr:hypothetical protein [Streptomyces sp. NEAU-YJ-81]MBO3674148.1 hypothetical protein [Streptomyces sp. NEAU-YJ-81]